MKHEASNSDLARAGIPMNLWHLDLEPPPGVLSYVEDAVQTYQDSTNLVVAGSTRLERMQLVAWMVEALLTSHNPYYRYSEEFKHNDPCPIEYAPIFRVKVMDVDTLTKVYTDENAYEDGVDPWKRITDGYDFFFITEVGSEFANTFKAKVLLTMLEAREGSCLPVVATLNKTSREVSDKYGVAVYKEVGEILNRYRKLGLA